MSTTTTVLRRPSRRHGVAPHLLAALALLGLSPDCAPAADVPAGPEPVAGDAASSGDLAQRFAVHGQGTFVEQATDGFHAPYAGPNSLSPAIRAETYDLTLMLGARLWQGAEAWADPEIDQGYGLDDTLGMAGFPSGEAYKVGSHNPYFRLPRLFIRQTINTGAVDQAAEASANQLAARRSEDRWVFTVGKFSVTDVFDANQYAHDPRQDFLNWAAVDAGTFDYAADAWGFTVGAAAERYWGPWTVRAGVFDLSIVPNSETLDHGLHQFQMILELEQRYSLFGQTGRVLLTGYDSRARLGSLGQALRLAEATDTTPDAARVRQYRSRLGLSVDVEQPLSDNAGLFARAGRASGNVEVEEFTDIDRTVALGASLKGTHWRRPADTVGLVLIDNAISGQREQYLALGGLGILVGDGRLPHPGTEQILETYYEMGLLEWAHVSFDYQWARNPAYNTDRGPVSVFAVRVHLEF